MARKLTFTHPRTGETYHRTTSADYSHVSIKQGEIKWHGSREAAQRRGGEIFPVAGSAPDPSRVFNDRRQEASGGGCTVSVSGGKCGKPAAKTWTNSNGEVFRECKEHA